MPNNCRIDDLKGLQLKATNLKCIQEMQGFDSLKPLNVIIGKNNTGKSTLIDIVGLAVTGKVNQVNDLQKSEIVLSCDLPEEILRRSLDGTSGGYIGSYFHFAKHNLSNSPFEWPLFGVTSTYDFYTSFLKRNQHVPDAQLRDAIALCNQLSSWLGNPFAEYKFGRILADRDISPELVAPKPEVELPELQPNGTNATKLIALYLTEARLDRSLVERDIVSQLNAILNPDVYVDRIVPRRRMQGDWELYIEERGKALIPLSQMGSGLKTVLLVLLHLYLVPKRDALRPVSLDNWIFGFEELENNLHPSLQRRLFLYLAKVAKETKCTFFITTHSHVVIDLFARVEDAQILHVKHNGKWATISPITTHLGHRSIFSDLEVRPSDLLQTNALIWVEGPSDRIYLNKWISLWSNDTIKEHVDYEFAFTGGSLIANISYDEPELEKEKIEALKINGNAIVVIDSDKRLVDDDLKARADRVAEEISKNGGFAWVTAGKEIENYIPPLALKVVLDDSAVTPDDEFVDIFQFIEDSGGLKYRGRKPLLAELVCEATTLDMLKTHLDLAERLDSICLRLKGN